MKTPIPILFVCAILVSSLSSCVGYSIEVRSFQAPGYKGQKAYAYSNHWKKTKVFSPFDSIGEYEKIADVYITGARNSSEKKLFKRLKMEASKFFPDAIIHIETKEVERDAMNGVNALVNFVSIFSDDGNNCDDYELETYEEYRALKVHGIAIKFMA